MEFGYEQFVLCFHAEDMLKILAQFPQLLLRHNTLAPTHVWSPLFIFSFLFLLFKFLRIAESEMVIQGNGILGGKKYLQVRSPKFV